MRSLGRRALLATPAALAATPSSASPFKIDFCGDSTMAGAVFRPGFGYDVSPHRVPVTVQGLMGSRAECRNIAVGGSTTQNWLYGQSLVAMPWAARMAATDASLIVLNTGINDAFVPGMTAAIYEFHWRELRRIAAASGKTLICCTPNPIHYFPHINSLWEFQNGLKAAAPSFGMPVIDVWGAIVAAAPSSWPALLPDAIHPGDELYRMIGGVTYVGLRPFVP